MGIRDLNEVECIVIIFLYEIVIYKLKLGSSRIII